MSESADKKNWRPAMSIFLGQPEEAKRRKEALDRIARNLGVSRSKLFMMIADGQLLVITPPPHMLPAGTDDAGDAR